MEKLPYQEEVAADAITPAAAPPEPPPQVRTDWRHGLPSLDGSIVTLRDLRPSDGRALFVMLTTDEVTRFISPPPPTIEGFEKFIAWSARQRAAGQYACFAIVPRGSDTAIGIVQVRSLAPDFDSAEWGFALASEFWGTGIFIDGARLAIGFAFETLGVQRLEARTALANSRGNAALRKLGALREGILRRSFLRHGERHDQALWTLLAEEWPEAQQRGGSPRIH